jgi:hypothetical protein
MVFSFYHQLISQDIACLLFYELIDICYPCYFTLSGHRLLQKYGGNLGVAATGVKRVQM